jgi:NaMN:DMB phosphoribosyltransferase
MGVIKENLVSSSSPNNPRELKMKTVMEGLNAAGIKIGDLANDPLKAIECVGDPMMPANVGMIIGAAKHVPVIVGGGTQMAAVIAAAVKLDPSIKGNIFQGTTRWLMEDPKSNMSMIMDSVSPDVPIVYVNMDYSSSPYEGLQAYEWGYIKEGVGCGGSSVAAIIQSSGKVTCDDLLDKVHEIYKKIMNFD